MTIPVTTANTAEFGSGPFSMAANAERTINFDTDLPEVEVGVYGSTDFVYVSVNRAAATVGGKHCIPIPPAAAPGATTVTIPIPTSGNAQVRLITAGTVTTAWVTSAWDPRNG